MNRDYAFYTLIAAAIAAIAVPLIERYFRYRADKLREITRKLTS